MSTVKLFPAEALGGIALIRALAAPFPEARFVPTGGLGADNAAGYLALPQVARDRRQLDGRAEAARGGRLARSNG